MKPVTFGTRPHGSASHADVTRSIYLDRIALTAAGSSTATQGSSPTSISTLSLPDGSSTGGFGTRMIPGDAKPASPLTMTIYWLPDATVGGDTAARWFVDAIQLSAAGDNTMAAGTQTTWTGVNGAKTQELLVIEATTEVLASVSANGLIRFHIRRVGADAADTYTGNVRIIGVRLDYLAVQ